MKSRRNPPESHDEIRARLKRWLDTHPRTPSETPVPLEDDPERLQQFHRDIALTLSRREKARKAHEE